MTEPFDVLVVGAGPGGLAAACAAAEGGARVGLIDAQANPGGQVWRHDVTRAAPSLARRSIQAALAHPSIHWMRQTQVVAAENRQLLVEDPQQSRWIGYRTLILATGARELLLPFPGWTMPGVTGAGGLQALAKQGWPLRGQRVAIAGSGPLLLAAAATARRHGAHVLGIYEQASARQLRAFAGGLWRWPGKALQAAALRAELAGVPYRTGCIVSRVHGSDRLREVVVESARGRETIACDHLAIGYGLVPNVELPQMLGCRLRYDGAHPLVDVDARLHTSIDGVFAIGELCGIGGRDSARVEGAIAGHVAVGHADTATRLAPRRRRARAFADHLKRHFALAPRIHRLAEPDTLVCRCEDVPLSALEGYDDARSAKLATRCGMGACQGRLCGSALAELGRFPRSGARPPLFPARLSTLGSDPASIYDR